MLFKKALRDLRSNWKQFISIIFIIGLAVTLFVGLQANYLSLKNRVDDFYSKGNVASYFMTYGLVDENEEKNINDIIPFNVDTNLRMSVSAKLEGKGINIVVSDTYPTVSKAYKLLKDGTSNQNLFVEDGSLPADDEDFFILDKSVFTFINQDPSREQFENKYKIGDEIELSISISSYKDTILGNFDSIFDSFSSMLSEEDAEKTSTVIKDYIAKYVEENGGGGGPACFTQKILQLITQQLQSV